MITLNILTIFGAVLLLLYGIKLVGEGLQRAVGEKLRELLLAATSNPLKSLGVGTFITALLQSSSATTVMLVSFVGAGLMTLKQTMGVILGAGIGTTLTVQIIAFEVYELALPIVGIGILVKKLASRDSTKDIGHSILGFGFVFLSLKILIETFKPFTENPIFADIITSFGAEPLAAILVSALLTALFQSSAATLGVAITGAVSGIITLDAIMPIVLGANIGTCSTAILASIGANVESKRVATAHIGFNVLGVVIALPLLGQLTELVAAITTEPARQVAMAHSIFNVLMAIVFLPLAPVFVKLIIRLLPEGDVTVEEKFGPKYLDPMVMSSPSLALGQATRESLRVAEIVQDMLKKSLKAFSVTTVKPIIDIEEKDDDVDLLDREIKFYLTRLSSEGLSPDEARREIEIISFTNNMENIGDVIDKNLMDMARKKLKNGYEFSSEGIEEIKHLHSEVMENFVMSVTAFNTRDKDIAQKLLNRKPKIAEYVNDLKNAHLDRLRKGLKESLDTSSIHLDILSNLKRINSYTTNIAYDIFVDREKKTD